MRKTEEKLNNLLRMFREADEDQQPPSDDVSQPPQEAPEPPKEEAPASKVSQSEKEIIDLLARSFLFNPTNFPAQKSQIESAINSIRTSVNVPIPTVIDNIEDIVSLNVNLRKKPIMSKLINNLEARAIKIFGNISILSEKLRDATEPQAGDQGEKAVEPGQKVGGEAKPVENSEFKLDLQEIFPMYQALISKALYHVPSEEEIINLQAVVDEFTDLDPKKIVTTIKNMLSQSLEDTEVETDLADV
jgi:hypothetical protein